MNQKMEPCSTQFSPCACKACLQLPDGSNKSLKGLTTQVGFWTSLNNLEKKSASRGRKLRIVPRQQFRANSSNDVALSSIFEDFEADFPHLQACKPGKDQYCPQAESDDAGSWVEVGVGETQSQSSDFSCIDDAWDVKSVDNISMCSIGYSSSKSDRLPDDFCPRRRSSASVCSSIAGSSWGGFSDTE
mmetsp:Transcript_53562/g.125250  ORF Transcript_53562/g.125250 Transcript_53562/m.125250 type:complete len:188 (-) Transcript_53562:284-847(-)